MRQVFSKHLVLTTDRELQHMKHETWNTGYISGQLEGFKRGSVKADAQVLKLEAEIERLKSERKRLDHRIHCQRKANRDNWEIVDIRQKWMGSPASRQSYIRHRKIMLERAHKAEMERDALKAELAEIRRTHIRMAVAPHEMGSGGQLWKEPK